MSARKLQAQLHKVVAEQRRVRDGRRLSGRSDPQAEAALQALERAEVALRQELRRVQSAESRAENAGEGRKAKVTCPMCKLKLRYERGVPVKAHLHPSSTGAWCSGGALPNETEKQRAVRKRQATKDRYAGSVWTVSGGLPTLGKRR